MVDLPQPDSPTSASVSPLADREGDALDGMHAMALAEHPGAADCRSAPSGRRPRPPARRELGRPPFGCAAASRRGAARRRAAPACSPRAARERSGPTGPVSTCCPACMTITRSAISATTPMSWVMRMSAVPKSRWSVRISSRICACTVTSSAVVGSSAMRTFGIAGERHRDHHPLAHAAGQLVRILVETRAPARRSALRIAPGSPRRAPRACRRPGACGWPR